jgi:hypothetical protein
MTTTREHAQILRAVGAHFAQRASRRQTTLLRAHLPSCAACRRRYERGLLLASLDPRAPSAEDRLATGLGLGPSARAPAPWAFASLAIAAAAALLLWWPGAAARFRAGAEPVARGGLAVPSLLIYRVGADGASTRVTDRLGRDDELAFGYANPGGLRFVMVFGTDEHGHVYWFHPAWPLGAPPPAAVEARPGPGPYELPEAVRHRFDGRQLRVSAVFSDERLGVEAIERDGQALPLPLASRARRLQMVTRTLEIEP